MSKKLSETKLKEELKSFQNLWKGGFFEGEPLSPTEPTNYYLYGETMTVLHATYLKCIKPFINENTVALEIGPGRGAWTKTMLKAKEITVIDALSAEHNQFFEYVGRSSKIKYIQVNDFLAKELPDNHFNYMFSFGCLCHVSFEGIAEYATNLFKKLAPGCNCFWMIADYDKLNNAFERQNELDYALKLLRKRRLLKILVPYYRLFKIWNNQNKVFFADKNEDNEPRAGRWYHCGVDRCQQMLQDVGYRIIESDVDTVYRDPIIHFTKD